MAKRKPISRRGSGNRSVGAGCMALSLTEKDARLASLVQALLDVHLQLPPLGDQYSSARERIKQGRATAGRLLRPEGLRQARDRRDCGGSGTGSAGSGQL